MARLVALASVSTTMGVCRRAGLVARTEAGTSAIWMTYFAPSLSVSGGVVMISVGSSGPRCCTRRTAALSNVP